MRNSKSCCTNLGRKIKILRRVIFRNEVIYLTILCVGFSAIAGISSKEKIRQQSPEETIADQTEETPTASLVGNSARFLRKAVESSEGYETSATEETSAEETTIAETTTVEPTTEETTIAEVTTEETTVEIQETQQYLPEESAEQNSQPTYISDEDKKWMARVVFVEARGECYEGQVAVAAVILNRYHYNNEQISIYDIVTAPHQFGDQIYGVTDEDLEAYPYCMRAVEEALSGVDPTQGCRYFYDPRYVSGYQAEIRGNLDYIQIGNHRFHWSL